MPRLFDAPDPIDDLPKSWLRNCTRLARSDHNFAPDWSTPTRYGHREPEWWMQEPVAAPRGVWLIEFDG